jgi:hypothetical protein
LPAAVVAGAAWQHEELLEIEEVQGLKIERDEKGGARSG